MEPGEPGHCEQCAKYFAVLFDCHDCGSLLCTRCHDNGCLYCVELDWEDEQEEEEDDLG